MKLHVLLSFVLFFLGKTIGGSQAGTKVREAAGEGIHWKVVHASGDSVKGPGAGKEKDKKGPRVGIELGRKVGRKRLRHVGGYCGIWES